MRRQCREMGISPDFLRYNTRTDTQAEMIKEAMNIISRWPLHIYGASDEEGQSRSLAASVVGTKDLSSRWSYLIDEYGAKVFVTDHLQQYSFEKVSSPTTRSRSEPFPPSVTSWPPSRSYAC